MYFRFWRPCGHSGCRSLSQLPGDTAFMSLKVWRNPAWPVDDPNVHLYIYLKSLAWLSLVNPSWRTEVFACCRWLAHILTEDKTRQLQMTLIGHACVRVYRRCLLNLHGCCSMDRELHRVQKSVIYTTLTNVNDFHNFWHSRPEAPFLPARRYASAGLCDSDVSVRLSVRLSHAGIVPSRAKAGSWNVHLLIAPWL